MRKILLLSACGLACLPCLAQDSKLNALAAQEIPSLVATYKALHAAPELSGHEEKTSALLAERLRALGYEVTDHVGKYENSNWKGYGVVAILKNGPGPTVLVRTDLDALPVEEKTGLPYASKVRVKDDSGVDVPVMHACGHDVHITSLIGAAKMLAELKDRWHGTLMLIGQPAEERVGGARAMLADGLYARFGKPDYAIALHDGPTLAGTVSYTPGYSLSSATSVDVTIRGRGGHGSAPQASKDPIVLAAEYIMAIQTITSRERSPFDPAVVTVGSIHGGTKHNIIPDDVHLQLTVRTYKEEVRQQILASLKRIADGLAQAAGVPADRMPSVEVSETTMALYNNPEMTARVAAALKRQLGAQNVTEAPPNMASEDFGYFGGEDHAIPLMMFSIGAIDADRLAAYKKSGAPVPTPHSALFYPTPEPTIRTAVEGMTAAVIELMKK
ncbi:MAG TPA: amidohydrolase [Candidatus Acidoferrales bacterium]|nr:amidohydrolase [Candidatus Acidoferrales bacterium]